MVDCTDIPNRFILVHEAAQNFLLLYLLSGQVQDRSVSLVELELLIANEAGNFARFLRLRLGSDVALCADLMLARQLKCCLERVRGTQLNVALHASFGFHRSII